MLPFAPPGGQLLAAASAPSPSSASSSGGAAVVEDGNCHPPGDTCGPGQLRCCASAQVCAKRASKPDGANRCIAPEEAVGGARAMSPAHAAPHIVPDGNCVRNFQGCSPGGLRCCKESFACIPANSGGHYCGAP